MEEEFTEIPITVEPLTPAEVQAKEDLVAERAVFWAEYDGREAAKQSALEKLSKLGLTEEEAKAVVGL